MKIKAIQVQVIFHLSNGEEVSQSCMVDTDNVNKIRVADLTDACQRAVAHCIDELESFL